MSYVELNPIRAGISEDLASSWHTIAARRVVAIHSDLTQATVDLTALRPSIALKPLSLKADAYLELIDWTAQQLRPDKRGAIAQSTARILTKLLLHDRLWQYQVLGIESRYYRAIGCANALVDKARAIGQC